MLPRSGPSFSLTSSLSILPLTTLLQPHWRPHWPWDPPGILSPFVLEVPLFVTFPSDTSRAPSSLPPGLCSAVHSSERPS